MGIISGILRIRIHRFYLKKLRIARKKYKRQLDPYTQRRKC